MKHQNLIERFVSNSHEFDGYCHIHWLPGKMFDGALEGACSDILGAYLDPEHGYQLSFLVSEPPDDVNQRMASLSELPYSVQKMIYKEIF